MRQNDAVNEVFDAYEGAAKEIAAGQQSSRAEMLRAMQAAYGPRQCVDERYLEADGYYGPRGEEGRRPDYTVKEWRFYYSDGTTETLTMREPVK